MSLANPLSSPIKKATLLLLGLYFFCKLIISHFIPLIGDEAYYWVWSKNLQLSYYDHPPFVAWLFRGANWIPFMDPRWLSIVFSCGTLWVWWKIADRHFKLDTLGFSRKKLWWMALMISPLIGFGSILVTPDVPLLLFWSLAIYCLQEIAESKSHLSFWYSALGLSLGLGFSSKYHIVLLVLAAITFLTFEKKWNLIRPSHLILTVFFGILGCLPVLIWNWQNDFRSFLFQIQHGLGEDQWDYQWTLNYILGQVLCLIPFVFAKSFFKKPVNNLQLIHFYCGWVPLFFFFLSSFRGAVEVNWPLMSFPHLLLLYFLNGFTQRWVHFYFGFWVLTITIIIFCALNPQKNFINGKLSEPKKFTEISESIQSYQPLFTSTYQSASSLWYLTQKPVYKLKGVSRYDFFDEMKESTPVTKKFYYLKENYQDLPEQYIKAGYIFKLLPSSLPAFDLYEVTK